MKCPACQLDLKMAERQGVEIDYCPQCRGVWLDRGELDKIIERSEQFSASQSSQAPQPSQARTDDRYDRDRDERYDRDRDDHYKKRKRGGFFGDLFDFD